MSKSTIYLEIEDDITSIIDKVKSADTQIVAVVPPKRSTVLQSSVNLKLLKKLSKESSKKIVLVTKDNALVPLAGSIGVYVSDSLDSKPYLPEKVGVTGAGELEVGEHVDLEDVPNTPIGVLDKTTNKTKGDLEPPKASKKSAKLLGSLPKVKGRVPNFNKFRLKLFLGGLLVVVLGVGWFVAFKIMPKAEVIVNAQTNRVRLEFELTLDSDTETDDLETKTLVPVTETLKKTFSDTFPATGEKNVGEKATGSIRIFNCYSKGQTFTLTGGTVLTSANGYQFETLTNTELAGGTQVGDDPCTFGETTVEVIAIEGGTNYEDAVNNFSVSGIPTADMYGQINVAFSGATDDIQVVPTQKDLDDALETLGRSSHSEFVEEIEAQFSVDYTPIKTSFKIKEGQPQGAPKVGDLASEEEVVVSLTYTYTMEGVKTESMDAILESLLVNEVGDTKLVIYDNGLADASMVTDKNTVTVKTNSFVGPDLDESKIAESVAGLKFGAAKSLLEELDGVSSVQIDLSPFWVFSLPKQEKITVIINVTAHVLQNTE